MADIPRQCPERARSESSMSKSPFRSASDGSDSAHNPKESDLEEIITGLMSSDQAFSDVGVSQAYLRSHGGQAASTDRPPLQSTSSFTTGRSSGSDVEASNREIGRERRKKEQNRKAQRAFRERKEQIMKTQSEQIAQLQKDLEKAKRANESIHAELEQLKAEASGSTPNLESM